MNPFFLRGLMLFLLPALSASADTLSKITERGSIVLAYRESSVPFSYLDGPGKPIGFGVDIANKVAEAIRQASGKKELRIEYQAVTSQNRVPLVANGSVDLECGSTTNNAARAKEVAFAVNYFYASSRLLVKKSSGIQKLGDLAGKAIATTTGTTTFGQLRKLSLERKLNLSVVPAKDHADGFLLLESGRAQAFAMDDILLAGLMLNAKNPDDYVIVGEPLQVEAYACMLRKDDPAFKKLVDGALTAMMKSGEFEKLYKKWFMSPIPPRQRSLALPISDRLRENLKSPTDQPAS
ncbi:MAG: amino acid ABC transporter substrate-binding protein [Betaproteobacteria bacterium]|nr:amino acid ABC transporter substrate-binding protein [Betaproteobacteria bacterium]